MRLGIVTSIAALVLLMLAMLAPSVGAQSVSRGALAGSTPAGATVGTLRGPLPAGATVGALRGPLPAGATVGALRGPLPAGATVGVMRGPLPAGATTGAVRGPLPPGATVGAVALPLPPGARFGEPTPLDIANRLDQLADVSTTDQAFDHATQHLGRSLTIRENTLGPDHPAIADSLDRSADVLRRMGRDSQAADLETRAEKIRSKPQPE